MKRPKTGYKDGVPTPELVQYMLFLRHRNGLRLSRFHPKTFLNRKHEAKKTGDYYAD